MSPQKDTEENSILPEHSHESALVKPVRFKQMFNGNTDISEALEELRLLSVNTCTRYNIQNALEEVGSFKYSWNGIGFEEEYDIKGQN